MIETYTSLHNHSEYSTALLRFADAINKIPQMVNWCYDNGLRGMALTDHQGCSGFVDLEQSINSLNIKRPFQHIFGNEFYTLSEEENELKNSSDPDKRPYYWHHLINAIDEEGLHQLYELSARAWKRSYTYRGLLRRPSFYTDFEEVVGKNPGHLISSSACLGGFLPHCILSGEEEEAKQFLEWNKQVFGSDNFFLECQPCYENNEEQITVNKKLWEIHEKENIPIIVTTDSHYMRPEDQSIHTAFLKSKDGGDSREPEKFYQTTYLFTPKELRDMLYLSDFNDTQIDVMFQTTNDIADRVQPITLHKKTRVPGLPSLPKFEIHDTFKSYYSKYPFIMSYAYSKDENERYYYAQIEKGLENYLKDHDVNVDYYLNQINTEMEQVRGLGEIFGERMSDYFTVIQKVVDLIWSEGDSLVGIGRGSAGCYVTNKLLGITGIDPLLPGLEDFYPWWRFCSIARSDSIFDIDIDIQSFKKEQIIKAIKDYFGERRVCQVVTWGKLTSKTALERAGKGLDIPDDIIAFIKSLIPVKRGKIYSIDDCLNGNKKNGFEKVPEFASEISKYPELLDTAKAFEGLVVSSGVHAGALNVLKDDFTDTGSMMVSANGATISQFDLHQAEYAGDLKFDLLSIDALECIRACIDLLIKSGHMQWKKTLRETYNHYLRYDVLEKENAEMWSLLPNMVNAFQYDSRAGQEALSKIGAANLTDLTMANGLMRLAVPNGEQPMDMYVRYRNNIQDWYTDMRDYGLNHEEIELYKELLGKYNGVMIAQETMMIVLMDDRVCNFTLKEADKARKAVAKKSPEALAETEERLYKKGQECGNSKLFLDYLWLVQIEMSKSYAFAFCHSHEYSTECLQELNMYWKYPKVFWNTAVVVTQAQTEDERENSASAIDYGRIAKSIYKAKQNNVSVSQPSINSSELTFTPIESNDTILFGLGGIAGINPEIAQQVLSNRPYTSFKDFYTKNAYKGSLVTPSKFKQFIKAGCFDEFNPNRIHIMKQYILYSSTPVEDLNMANLPMIIKSKVNIPKPMLAPYNFYKYITRKEFFYSKHPKFKSKKLYWLDDKALKYFKNNCQNSLQEGVDYFFENDMVIIVDKSMEKLLKPSLTALKEYINTPEFITAYNKKLLLMKYNEFVPNQNIHHWEFESIGFYTDGGHELDGLDKDKYLISDFKDLPEEPIFVEKSWGKKTYRQYNLSQIAGTVIDRNDAHNLVTILTTDNQIVNIRFYSGLYARYKRQISEVDENGKKVIVDPSYFSRGQLLIVCGYRKEDMFVARKYKNSLFQHICQRIWRIHEDGSIDIQSSRMLDEED